MRNVFSKTCLMTILFAYIIGGGFFHAGATEAGRNLALCVGINGYARMGTLRYCVNDAHAVRDSLQASGNFRRVKVLTDVDESGKTLPIAELPTAGNILASLRQLAGLVTREGTLLFFFSGHGIERSGVNYLVPVDGDEMSALSLDDVKAVMAKSKARNKLIILDACRSGLGAKGMAGVRGNLEEESLAVLVSCGEDQFSYEVEKSERSLFSLILEEGLSGKADLDGDNEITGDELFRYLDFAMGDFCLDNNLFIAQTPAINEAGRGMVFLKFDPEALAFRRRDRENALERERAEARRVQEETRRTAEETRKQSELASRQDEQSKTLEALRQIAARRQEEEARQKQSIGKREEEIMNETMRKMQSSSKQSSPVKQSPKTPPSSPQFDMTGTWEVTAYAPPNRRGVYDVGLQYRSVTTYEDGRYVSRDVPNSYRKFGPMGGIQWQPTTSYFSYTYSNGVVTITDLMHGRPSIRWTVVSNDHMETYKSDGSKAIQKRIR